jgi:hypothetical protein
MSQKKVFYIFTFPKGNPVRYAPKEELSPEEAWQVAVRQGVERKLGRPTSVAVEFTTEKPIPAPKEFGPLPVTWDYWHSRPPEEKLTDGLCRNYLLCNGELVAVTVGPQIATPTPIAMPTQEELAA